MPATPLCPDLAALPGSLDDLKAAVERKRGRPLALTSAPLSPGSSTLLIEMDTVDLLIVSQAGSPADQLHAIAHQLAHLVRGHQGTPDDHLLRVAFPHLAPDLVAASLAACRYAPEDEHEADAYATRFVA